MYVFIGTGRSGSSLMFKLLQASKKFRDNAQSNTEPKGIADYIKSHYPSIKLKKVLSYLPKSKIKHILAKVPEFALIPELLTEKIDSKIIFIDRNLTDTIKSHMALRWMKQVVMTLGDGIKDKMVELGFISESELENPMLVDIAYLGLLRYRMKASKKVMVINFDEWMNNFKSVTGKVYDFLGIDYNKRLTDEWEILRKTKQQFSMRDFNNPENYKWDSIELEDIYVKRIKKIEGLIKNQ